MGLIEIHKKEGFSERKGIKHFSDIVQTDSLNLRTRNKIFSSIKNIYEDIDSSSYNGGFSDELIEYIYIELFSLTKNDIPETYSNFEIQYDIKKIFSDIRNITSNYDYNDIFDLIEGIILGLKNICERITYGCRDYYLNFIDDINRIFNEENVNYRIVNGNITDIVNSDEMQAVNNVLSFGKTVTQNHIAKSIELLYKNKDYANSIKESISAVESECQIITSNDKATLGQALKKLHQDIHPALKDAFEKLYGYASDANGIRHANGLGEGNSTHAEAKYMLISCSAFINYLRDEIKY